MFNAFMGIFIFNPFAVYLSAVYYLVRAIYASNPLVYLHEACASGFSSSRSRSGRGCCGARRCRERVHKPPSSTATPLCRQL